MDGTMRSPWFQGGIGSAASPPLPSVEKESGHSPARDWTTETRPRAGTRSRGRLFSDGRGPTSLRRSHDGIDRAGKLGPSLPSFEGYQQLTPEQLGWTRKQLLSYLAGIIDSDGNLRIEKRRVKGMIGPHYRINIRCGQVLPSRAVELLAATFGGRVGLSKSRRPNQRDLATWSLHDKMAEPAIRALLPYLVVKKTEALHLLQLRRLKAEGKQGVTEWVHANRWRDSVRMRKRCYTTSQVAAFERIRQAVLALHSSVPR